MTSAKTCAVVREAFRRFGTFVEQIQLKGLLEDGE